MEANHQEMSNALEMIYYQEMNSTISLDSLIVSAIVITAFVITIASFMRSYIVKTLADIIKIEDVNKVVINKYSSYHNAGQYTNSPIMTNRIFLKSIDGDSGLDILYTDKSTYDKYNRGDVINVQRVFYKHKNSIYSELVCANNEHYDRLKEYSDNNDVDVENLISKSSKIKKVSSPLYSIIMGILIIVFVALIFIKMFVII